MSERWTSCQVCGRTWAAAPRGRLPVTCSAPAGAAPGTRSPCHQRWAWARQVNRTRLERSAELAAQLADELAELDPRAARYAAQLAGRCRAQLAEPNGTAPTQAQRDAWRAERGDLARPADVAAAMAAAGVVPR